MTTREDKLKILAAGDVVRLSRPQGDWRVLEVYRDGGYEAIKVESVNDKLDPHRHWALPHWITDIAPFRDK